MNKYRQTFFIIFVLNMEYLQSLIICLVQWHETSMLRVGRPTRDVYESYT